MHRGPVKDKTPEGSAKRGRLLQALRSTHLERNEGVLDQLICNPRDPCQDLIRTARFDGLRLPPSTVASGTPCLHCHRVPNLASLTSTTTTFHSQVTTPLTEFSRPHEINPRSGTFATGPEESHSLKVTMENALNSAIPLHRRPLTRSAATPKVTPASSIANRMPARSALFGRTNGVSQTPLHNPSSVSGNCQCRRNLVSYYHTVCCPLSFYYLLVSCGPQCFRVSIVQNSNTPRRISHSI
ncbi:hypothetical protein P879_08541 [Paragonimus westermani]|uniref:Uncharacterized protein n=1 Tax=Paragonimus westermani TaxID=34504 RepID=A0A8T0DEJ7_9TREM|nr:hypothetical protein P879_08541 [Paragonimus westermani]